MRNTVNHLIDTIKHDQYPAYGQTEVNIPKGNLKSGRNLLHDHGDIDQSDASYYQDKKGKQYNERIDNVIELSFLGRVFSLQLLRQEFNGNVLFFAGGIGSAQHPNPYQQVPCQLN